MKSRTQEARIPFSPCLSSRLPPRIQTLSPHCQLPPVPTAPGAPSRKASWNGDHEPLLWGQGSGSESRPSRAGSPTSRASLSFQKMRKVPASVGGWCESFTAGPSQGLAASRCLCQGLGRGGGPARLPRLGTVVCSRPWRVFRSRSPLGQNLTLDL